MVNRNPLSSEPLWPGLGEALWFCKVSVRISGCGTQPWVTVSSSNHSRYPTSSIQKSRTLNAFHQRCHKPSPNCSLGRTIVVRVPKFEDIPRRPPMQLNRGEFNAPGKRREEATKEQEVRRKCLGRRRAQAPPDAPATLRKTTGDTHVRANAPHTLFDTKRKNKNTRKLFKDGRTLPAAQPAETRASPRTPKGSAHAGEL